MSARLARYLAIPCGLVAIAMRLWTDKFWPSGNFVSGALQVLVGLIVPFALYALLISPVWQRPKSFAFDGKHFTAPLAPFRAGSNAIVWMWFAAGPIVMFDNLVAGAIQGSVFLLLAVAWLITPRPWIALTPKGIVIQRLRRRVAIAWDDIAPGEPAHPRKRSLNLQLNGEPLYGTIPLSEELPVGLFFVESAFLADAIRHYAAHPEDRATIGTSEGLLLLSEAGASRSEGLAQLV